MPRHQQVLRQWKLLRRLERAPGGVSIAELAASEQLSERSLYRDLEALEAAGFPLYPDEVDGQRRWFLTDSFRAGRGVPLAMSEILALRCARSALEALEGTPFAEGLRELTAKLDSLLSPEALAFARQMDEAFVGDRFGRPDYGELAPQCESLQRAIAERRTVEIAHRSGKGEETRRRVDPYNLWVHGSVLYLVAWCHLRRAIRTFSLARLRAVELTDDHFIPDPAYDFASYSRRHFRIMSEGRTARVRIWFAPEAALYVRERTWHPTQAVTELEGGAIELAMEVDGLVEVASWIASFGPRARALEPPELVERVLGELRGALARYEPRPDE